MRVLYRFLIPIISLLMPLVACKKEVDPLLTIKVLSADNTPVQDVYLNVFDASAVISFPQRMKSTSDDGLIKFQLKSGKKYYIYLIADEAYSNMSIGNPEAQYVSTGIFKTQEEIKQSPRQTPEATVGGTKYADINGDGVVNKYDLVIAIPNSSSGETINAVLYLK